MYEQFFGLSRSPFKITPDTSLFYDGGRRGDVLGALVYAVQRGEGIVKVVGEVGSGKTMLCRMLQQELPESVEIVYIANPSVSPDDILFVIAHELKLEVAKDASKHEVMHLLQAHLLNRYTSKQQVVLFVEEAQGMPLETLEEIRLLSNLETDQEKLLQIILFGQPELDENLRISSIRQLKERITHEFNLSPLTNDEIHNYLNFRMREVGYTGPELIDNNIAKIVGKYSGGLLRRINIIADKVLLSAFAESTHTITPKHVKAAVKDSGFERSVDGKAVNNQGYLAWVVITLLLLIVAMGSVYWFTVQQKEQVLSFTNEEPQKPNMVELDKPVENSAVEEKQSMNLAQSQLPEQFAETKFESLNQTDQLVGIVATSEEEEPTEKKIPTKQESGSGESGLAASLSIKKKSLEQVKPIEKDLSLVQVANVSDVTKGDIAEKKLSISTKTANITKQIADKNKSNTEWVIQKLEISKNWLANQSDKGVSIQVMMRNKSATNELAQFLRQEWPLPIEQTYLYEVDAHGRQIYRVFYGKFLTLSDGQKMLAQLPEVVRANSPYLHSIYKMKKTLL